MDKDGRQNGIRPLYHFLKRPRTSYKYYDTPDGVDLIPKLIYTSKWGAFFGFAYGSYKTMVQLPRPKNTVWLVIETVRHGFPFVLAPAVYTITTYFVTQFRNKDEALNANIGGAAAGFVFGVWYRNGFLTLVATLLSAYACGEKKLAVQKGIQFPAPDPPRTMDSSWVLRNMDFTITKDIPGNWTTVPRPVPEPPPPPPPPPPQGICAGF